MVGTSREENEAFIYLAGHFGQKRLPMPRVVAVSTSRLCYLQTDLGHRSLFDALSEGREKGGRYAPEEKELLRRTIAELPRIQFVGAEGLDFGRCYPMASMDRTAVFFDLNYFKYCFLKTTGLDFNEVKLEKAFSEMAKDLVGGSGQARVPIPGFPGAQRHVGQGRAAPFHRLPRRAARAGGV